MATDAGRPLILELLSSTEGALVGSFSPSSALPEHTGSVGKDMRVNVRVFVSPASCLSADEAEINQ